MTDRKKMQQEPCPNCGVPRQREDAVFCSNCRFPLALIAGKYRLEELLAEGGQGAVYLARHIQLDRDPLRVVKIVKQELFERMPALVERFRREVQVTSALSQRCQHIVRIYDDFGEVPQIGRFYVMEYLEGKPLADLVEDPDKLPSLKTCLHIFLQLCDAMRFAHRDHIVHRDLKPENIMLIEYEDEPNFLKVLDFGIARPGKEDADSGPKLTDGIIGTPAYMAPEQLSGGEIDTRTDLYAMGCILFEMLTGRTPHHTEGAAQENFLELAMKKLTIPTPSPSKLRPDQDIPEALEAIVIKMLSLDPDQRYNTVEEVKRELKQLLKQLQRTRRGFADTMPEETPYITADAIAAGDMGFSPNENELPTGDDLLSSKDTAPAPAFQEVYHEETSIGVAPQPPFGEQYQENEQTAIATSPFNSGPALIPNNGASLVLDDEGPTILHTKPPGTLREPLPSVLSEKPPSVIVGGLAAVDQDTMHAAPPAPKLRKSQDTDPDKPKKKQALTQFLTGIAAVLVVGIGFLIWMLQSQPSQDGDKVITKPRLGAMTPRKPVTPSPRPVKRVPVKVVPTPVLRPSVRPIVRPQPTPRRRRTRPRKRWVRARRRFRPRPRVTRRPTPRRLVHQAVCPKNSGGFHWIKVKYFPRSASFRVLPSGSVLGSKYGNQTCIGFAGTSARLQISRKGYHACQLPIKRSDRQFRVVLQIDNPSDIFTGPNHYCKKSW